jgi:hypothetical protein
MIDGTADLLAEFPGSGGALLNANEAGAVAGAAWREGMRSLKTSSGVDAIEQILDESDSPLNKDQIAEQLKARGKAIGTTTLQSYLSREKKRFASLGRGRWTTLRKKTLAEI